MQTLNLWKRVHGSHAVRCDGLLVFASLSRERLRKMLSLGHHMLLTMSSQLIPESLSKLCTTSYRYQPKAFSNIMYRSQGSSTTQTFACCVKRAPEFDGRAFEAMASLSIRTMVEPSNPKATGSLEQTLCL